MFDGVKNTHSHIHPSHKTIRKNWGTKSLIKNTYKIQPTLQPHRYMGETDLLDWLPTGTLPMREQNTLICLIAYLQVRHQYVGKKQICFTGYLQVRYQCGDKKQKNKKTDLLDCLPFITYRHLQVRHQCGGKLICLVGYSYRYGTSTGAKNVPL